MTADTIGGVWTYAVELAGALAVRGAQVSLATMGAPLSAEQEAQLVAAGADLCASTYRLEWMEDAWPDVDAAGQWLLQLEEALLPDVVHLNGFVHASLPWRAPVLVVGHSCVGSWWRGVHQCEAPPEWQRYREAVTRGVAAAGAVVAPTRAFLEQLEQEYGTLGRSHVIVNGVAPPATPLVSKEPFVLAAGRMWDPAKNLATLRQAAAHVPWPVHVAGPVTGPDGQHVACAPLHELGSLPRAALQSLMARASIFAAPALYEPFGLGILEAAQHGCALVLGDIPTLRELWEGAALFVPPRDAGSLAAALCQLALEDDVRERLASAARERAREFGPELMAGRYLDLYRELCAPRARSRNPSETKSCA